MRVVSTVGMIAVLIGCNGSIANDYTVEGVGLVETEPGTFVGAFEIRAGVNDRARSGRVELDILGDGDFDASANIDLILINGLSILQEASSTPDSDARITWDLDVAACDGPGFVVADDGTCVLSAGMLFVGDGPYWARPAFSIKVWTDEEDADRAEFDAFIDVTVLNVPTEEDEEGE